jgi:dihydroneopterin aldolase
MTGDYVKSFLRNYAVQMSVGVCDYEKKGPQTVNITVEMEAHDAPRYDDPSETSLDCVIDYTQVHRFISEDLTKRNHIPLLESVAELIAAFCLKDPRVAKVTVRLEKPNILPGVTEAGIELRRVRGGG